VQAAIDAEVPVRLERQLVDVHVEVSVRGDRRRVGPENAWVADEGLGLADRWVEVVDGVLGWHQLVDQSVAVALEAVAVAAALALGGYVGVRPDLGQWVAVALAQVGGWDRVERVGGQWRVVNCLAVGAELDTVETLLLPGDGHAELAEVEWVAEVRWDVVWYAKNRVVLFQTAPGLAGTEIEHDETVAALVGGVDDVGDSLASGGDVGVEVEADVVHVRVWVVNGRWEGVGLVDGVVGQRDRNKLWSTELSIWHGWVACSAVDSRTSSVENPKSLWSGAGLWSDVECLNRDESADVATAEGDAGNGGVQGIWCNLEGLGWIGCLGSLVDGLTESVLVATAGVANKEATGGRDSKTDGPLVVVVVKLFDLRTKGAIVNSQYGAVLP